VAPTALAPTVIFPRLGARLAAARNRIEAPQELARSRVESPNGARRLYPTNDVGDRRSDDDDVSDDGRRRSHVVLPRINDALDAVEEIHFAVRAKVRAALAVRKVEREESRVECREENPARA